MGLDDKILGSLEAMGEVRGGLVTTSRGVVCVGTLAEGAGLDRWQSWHWNPGLLPPGALEVGD